MNSWDRAGVVMIRTRNGIDTVNVVMAGQTKVEVYKIQEVKSVLAKLRESCHVI